jgi:hypothetical protein
MFGLSRLPLSRLALQSQRSYAAGRETGLNFNLNDEEKEVRIYIILCIGAPIHPWIGPTGVCFESHKVYPIVPQYCL